MAKPSSIACVLVGGLVTVGGCGAGHHFANCNGAQVLPAMASSTQADRPSCGPGALLTVADQTGAPRYGCLVSPPGTGPLPLLVFLHGSSTSAVTYAADGPFAAAAATGDLSGGGPAGYHLLLPQSQLLEHTAAGRAYAWDGSEVDPAANHDAAALDALIAQTRARVSVDDRRVFIGGWSSGAFFAALYAFQRPAIAALALYAGSEAWDLRDYTDCPVPLLPTNKPPLMQVHHSCDAIVTCELTEKFLATLDPNWTVMDVILDDNNAAVARCDPSCSAVTGALNHGHWPASWEPQMRNWLAAHPRPQ